MQLLLKPSYTHGSYLLWIQEQGQRIRKINKQIYYSLLQPVEDHLGFKMKFPTWKDKGGLFDDSLLATGLPIITSKNTRTGKMIYPSWSLTPKHQQELQLSPDYLTLSCREMKLLVTCALDKNEIFLPVRYKYQSVSKNRHVPNRNEPSSN